MTYHNLKEKKEVRENVLQNSAIQNPLCFPKEPFNGYSITLVGAKKYI